MRDLLSFCTSPRDRISIQARLNLQDRRHLRERYLAPAISADWLTITDPAHPNSPEQKYRTTPLGVAYLGNVPPGDFEDSLEQST